MRLFRICMEYCKKIYYVRTEFVCVNWAERELNGAYHANHTVDVLGFNLTDLVKHNTCSGFESQRAEINNILWPHTLS